MLSRKTDDADVVGYCCLRIPVTNLRNSVNFYCDVLGYELSAADYEFGEAHVALKNGNGPGIFLMETNPEDITQMKFKFPKSFFVTSNAGQVTMAELLTNDLLALHERMKQAGVQNAEDPVFTEEFGYFTFFDPDGHYFRAVEERGEYFELKRKISSALQRDLSEHEHQLLWGLCEKTSVEQQKFLRSILSEVKNC